jgi:hypothetical protein
MVEKKLASSRLSGRSVVSFLMPQNWGSHIRHPGHFGATWEVSIHSVSVRWIHSLLSQGQFPAIKYYTIFPETRKEIPDMNRPGMLISYCCSDLLSSFLVLHLGLPISSALRIRSHTYHSIPLQPRLHSSRKLVESIPRLCHWYLNGCASHIANSYDDQRGWLYLEHTISAFIPSFWHYTFSGTYPEGISFSR